MSKLGCDAREINEIANLAFVSGSETARSVSACAIVPEIVTARGSEAL